jgi:alcohol dehydrogenase class IV
MLQLFDVKSDARVLVGMGMLDQLGQLAKEFGFTRTLLVSDPGLAKAGHIKHAHTSLNNVRIRVFEFSDFGPNPDTHMVEAGRAYAAGKEIDSIVGLGGGSSLDCAKAGSHYDELLREAGRHNGNGNPGEALARRLEERAAAGGLPATLTEVGASKADLPALAQEDSEQWTAKFNPRPVDAAGAREVYECAF